MIAKNKEKVITPEKLYTQRNLKYKDINIGDILPVIVEKYNWDEGKIKCIVSNKVRNGFIKEENFAYPNIPHSFDQLQISPAISTRIGKQVVAKVVAKEPNGVVELDRSAVMKETRQYFSENIGIVVKATINAIYSYGAFIDIGNGVETLLHVSEFSECWYSDLGKIFKVGEQIKVKILKIEDGKFTVSRKQAYPKLILDEGSIQMVRIFNAIPGGAYVEYNPMTIGIMDNSYYTDLSKNYGKYAMCCIRKNRENGFKASLSAIIED